MAYTNAMTKLLDKIEIRLGMKAINLPEDLAKDKWADIIINQSIETFSRYYPLKVSYEVKQETRKGKYYIIDETYIAPNIKILGLKDLKWDEFSPNVLSEYNQPYGIYDLLSNQYDFDDIALIQARSNQMSLFNNGVYPEFVYPNKIAIKNAAGVDICLGSASFKVEILIEHSPNLQTISPTKMETFEKLAQADVATFLYQNLKYYEGLETVFANVQLHLDELQMEATKRDEVMNKIEDGYVSAGNEGQPSIYCI